MNAYTNWLSYARGATDAQLRNIYNDEMDRVGRSDDAETAFDSERAVAACQNVAVERGLLL